MLVKNVCFLVGNLSHSGGTEKVTTLISNQLSQKDYQVSILSLVDGKDSFFPINSEIQTYSLFSKKISMRKNYFSAVSKIREFCIHHKVDTLIVVDSISCVFTVPALIGLGIKHICWEHFNLKVNLNSRFRDLGRWMAAKWCDHIVTLTERDKGFWIEKYKIDSKDKVISISNPNTADLQENIPSLEHKNILTVGRLTHQKGYDLLIEAWAKIAHSLPEWKITIVGIGEDEQMLKKMAKDNNVQDSIHFVGQQKNMDFFYREASFFCMSSRFEGLPMVLLEAQNYCLPIVSFDCDTGPAEVIVNDYNGYLVPSGNVDELSNKIQKMVMIGQWELQRLGGNMVYSREKFKIDKIMNNWLFLI